MSRELSKALNGLGGQKSTKISFQGNLSFYESQKKLFCLISKTLFDFYFAIILLDSTKVTLGKFGV